MGNGNEASGDGWRYKGRGLIQLTGKSNYSACEEALGVNLLDNPEWLEKAEGAVAAAAWFWDMRKLNTYADQDDIRAITKRINGGYHGLTERMNYVNRAKQVLGIL